jgi:hypothetical protein
VAILFQGRFRTTEDIDIIITHDKMKIPPFVTFCQSQGLSLEEYELEVGLKEKSHISILDLPNNIRIDLKGVYTLWDKAAVQDTEIFEYENVKIRVAKPEYLISNKLYKGGEIDLEDAFSVYIRNEERIDLKLLQKLARMLGVEKSLMVFKEKVRKIQKDLPNHYRGE